ncbi:hypothetical protein Q5P01_004566 [Channa striata]|uniref:Uncharacterized protein n=1 Tax=Channa striata TaxID=64152 RepID=A0AA88NEH9_CHASR|nr:hypothetical protein Q5P01_004566 [Channa striata]
MDRWAQPAPEGPSPLKTRRTSGRLETVRTMLERTAEMLLLLHSRTFDSKDPVGGLQDPPDSEDQWTALHLQMSVEEPTEVGHPEAGGGRSKEVKKNLRAFCNFIFSPGHVLMDT